MKNITKYHIRNFQSIKDLEIELDGDGLYWIRGKNNIGKSNLLRAMSTVFTNVSNNSYKPFIRDNCTTFKIKVWFEDDWVELARGATDYYEWLIDGVHGRVDKTAGKVPDELVEYFNLYYEAEKTKRYLNITSSDDPLLFVSTTGGDNDRLLQIALGTEVVMGASKRAEQLKRQATAEQKTIRTLLSEQEEQLTGMQARHDTLSDQIEQLDRLELVLDNEYKITTLLKNQQELVTDYALLGSKLIELMQDEELIKTANLEQQHHDIQVITKQLKQEQDYQTFIKTEQEIQVLTSEELASLTNLEDSVLKINQQVEQESLYQQLLQASEVLELQSQGVDELDTEFSQLAHIKKHLNDLKVYQKLEQDLVKAEEVVKEVTAEYERLREEIGECPLCGSSLVGTSHTH